MVLRIPQSLVMLFPFLLFAGEVILVLTVGPVLIAKARAKRALPPTKRIHRVGLCFGASIAAILAWMAMLYTSGIILLICGGIHPALGWTVGVILLVAISAITLHLAARICAAPVEDPKTAPRRRRYFFTPGLLILVCIWAFWATFLPWLNNVRIAASRAVDLTSMIGISKAIELYHSEYGNNPDRLGQLIETNCASPKYFNIYTGGSLTPPEYVKDKPYYAPKEIHYIRLPEDAPGDLLWVWPDPALFNGKKSPVLFKDGRVEWLWPEEIPKKIEQTYEWLLKNREKRR